jgi:hypothetical protein
VNIAQVEFPPFVDTSFDRDHVMGSEAEGVSDGGVMEPMQADIVDEFLPLPNEGAQRSAAARPLPEETEKDFGKVLYKLLHIKVMTIFLNDCTLYNCLRLCD